MQLIVKQYLIDSIQIKLLKNEKNIRITKILSYIFDRCKKKCIKIKSLHIRNLDFYIIILKYNI